MLHAQEGIQLEGIALHYLTCMKSKRLKVKGFGLSEDSQQQKWQSFDKFKFNLKGHKHRLFFFPFCLFSVVLK